MKRVGRLGNKVIVQADGNEITENQILIRGDARNLTQENSLSLFTRANNKLVEITPSVEPTPTPEYPIFTEIKTLCERIELCPNKNQIMGVANDTTSGKFYAIGTSFYQNIGDFYIPRYSQESTLYIVMLDIDIHSLLPEINGSSYTEVVSPDNLSSHIVCQYKVHSNTTTLDSSYLPSYSNYTLDKIKINSILRLYSIVEDMWGEIIMLPSKPIYIGES